MVELLRRGLTKFIILSNLTIDGQRTTPAILAIK
jgi:hypothetical protein